ncbi:transposase [Kovacikia minuta CCNUW1]|uniref:transposase n=1 Tax=Kovacikia minuta TaxID=2931930 RepID=UPI001CCC2922|nr:transposase [Kovacikia minuta]UBF27441.1 transposase [Kovacikia minuta CCNUW1]
MKYDPDKHHRRSIRLQGYDYASAGAYFITICTHQRQCLFGAVVAGEMRLNEFGQIARSHWLKLPNYHSHLRLDEFVVMPNHLHGILVVADSPVGAGFDVQSMVHTDNPLAKPAPTDALQQTSHHGIPEIIRGFKTFSARRINQIRRVSRTPVWQRNYYEHIIRDESSLERLRQYIHNNPQSWQQDQLHPDVPEYSTSNYSTSIETVQSHPDPHSPSLPNSLQYGIPL